jgi:hypothetical protein
MSGIIVRTNAWLGWGSRGMGHKALFTDIDTNMSYRLTREK